MGRGSYHGGSTIIYPGGGWSSSDPAESRSNNKAQSKARRARKNKKKPKKEPDLAALRLGLLSNIVHSEVAELPPPKIPRRSPESLRQDIEAKAGLLDWARNQPEYKRLLARKLSRYSQRRTGLEKKKANFEADLEKKRANFEADRDKRFALSEIGISGTAKSLFTATVGEAFKDAQEAGAKNDPAIAEYWNRHRFFTASGKPWTIELVSVARERISTRNTRTTQAGDKRVARRTGRILRPISRA